MFRFRLGRFWKTATVKRDFYGPAPESHRVPKGTEILYRLGPSEMLLPGYTRPISVTKLHWVLKGLAKPSWPWRVPKWKPIKIDHSKTTVRPVRFPDRNPSPAESRGVGLVDWLLEDPKRLEAHLNKNEGWVERLLASDPSIMNEDAFKDFDWGTPEGHRREPGPEDASVPFKGGLRKPDQ